MNDITITLPNGYNGHTVECLIEPIEEDDTTVKLRVAGSSYLIRWVYKDEWREKVSAALMAQTEQQTTTENKEATQ